MQNKKKTRALIGNGKDTSIWEDPWLNSLPAKPVCQTRRINPLRHALVSKLSKVSELLLPDGRQWNRELIVELLCDSDQRSIESIQAGGLHCMDSYSWDYTSSGIYTVKSGYWVYVNKVQHVENQTSQNQPSYEPLFKIIWDADIPPKLQHFLWKSLTGCIPVAERLRYRHLIKNDNCPRCFESEESVNHLFFQCPYARLVWALSPLPAPIHGVMDCSFPENFYRIMSRIPKFPYEKEAGKIGPWILWRLWKNRNDYTIKGIDYGAEETVNKAMEDWEEWLAREKEEEATSKAVPRCSTSLQWTPPPQALLKCNTDGAWCKNNDCSGVGWILRDSSGQVLWLGIRSLPRLRCPLEVEAEAMRWAILCLKRFNFKKVILETDSQVLVAAFNEENSWPALRPWIQDCKNLLGSFDEAMVVFTGRSGNKAADRAAKEAISLENNVTKLYSLLPSWISSVIKEDTPNV